MGPDRECHHVRREYFKQVGLLQIGCEASACARQEEHGGAGVYSADLRKGYQLKSDEWKYDILPEIIDGHNVLDFVDADIEARLAALEREEDALAAAAALEVRRWADMHTSSDIQFVSNVMNDIQSGSWLLSGQWGHALCPIGEGFSEASISCDPS